jgi:hypothetical protein
MLSGAQVNRLESRRNSHEISADIFAVSRTDDDRAGVHGSSVDDAGGRPVSEDAAEYGGCRFHKDVDGVQINTHASGGRKPDDCKGVADS